MTRELLNTLYVQTQDAYVHLKGGTILVEHESMEPFRVPLHHLGALVVFGVVHISAPLIQQCAEDGRAVVWLDQNGRFKARVGGKTSGNVLLRRDQWKAHFDEARTLAIAQAFVAGKLQNARQVLMRGAREYNETILEDAATHHAEQLEVLRGVPDIDTLRGIEGLAAQVYFEAFPALIRVPKSDFNFSHRSRRPPRDRTNALLSFLYSLGTGDCVSALEGVGLDPQVGFLHVLRPGRPALALDLIEEFRSVVLDRLALTLINRKELKSSDFEESAGGGVLLSADGRKKVLVAYQNRKKLEVSHGLLQSKVPIGLLPHLQARILARHLRGDIPFYTPWMV